MRSVGGVKGLFATAALVVAMLLSSSDTAWTAHTSTFSTNVDPSLRAGELAIVHTTSGSAGALSVKLSGLGATGVETAAAADTVIARLSPAALAALKTDRSVTVAAGDTAIVALDGGPNSYERGDESGSANAPGVTADIKAAGAPGAWSTTKGAGVLVGVMDTGIAYHPDLEGKVVTRVDFVRDGSRLADPAGHGTHIAGVIAANGGMTGMAPAAKLVSLRVLDANGAGSLKNVVQAFDWILEHRAQYPIKVLNLSWGMPQPTSYNNDLVAALAESAWFSGVTVVASAGNAGPNTISTPAADPFVIGVGSFNAHVTPFTLSPFSSFGTTIDGFSKPEVVAPGQSVLSLRVPGLTYYANGVPVGATTDLYVKMTGTSASAAFVSGAAALVIAAHGGRFSPNQVKGAIVASTSRIKGSVAGGVNAGGAVSSKAGAANAKIAPSKLLLSMLTNSGLIKAGITWEDITWEDITWDDLTWDDITWEGITWDDVTWDAAAWQ